MLLNSYAIIDPIGVTHRRILPDGMGEGEILDILKTGRVMRVQSVHKLLPQKTDGIGGPTHIVHAEFVS